MNQNLRILLVDDHSLLRRGLKVLFERELKSATVGEAASAEAAYEILRETPADLVVMDLHMPGDDGIVAAQKIKSHKPQTKVLLLSGQTNNAHSEYDVQRALLAGIDGYVSKADGDGFILAAVDALLRGQVFLSPGPATQLARELRAAAASQVDGEKLTKQEASVLRRLAEGASYKDIASELEISVKSVDTYRTRLTRKLGATSREDLVKHARRLGLTDAK